MLNAQTHSSWSSTSVRINSSTISLKRSAFGRICSLTSESSALVGCVNEFSLEPLQLEQAIRSVRILFEPLVDQLRHEPGGLAIIVVSLHRGQHDIIIVEYE